jgi:hypothetical protein
MAASVGELPPAVTMRLASPSSLTWSMIMLHSQWRAPRQEKAAVLFRLLG